MGKIIRPTYPKELSIGVLLIVFAIAYLLSGQVMLVHGINEEKNRHIGMFLLSCAVILMVLVMWEEFLFPVKVKHEGDALVFRNHRTKLKYQILLYLSIPVIFVFIYNEYEVNHVRFAFWVIVCVCAPVVGKLVSGINNYNDFLKLSASSIEYKNNAKVGVFAIKDLQQIILIKDERKVLHKIQVVTADGNNVTIDLDQMEIHDFIEAIDGFIGVHYAKLVSVKAG